jgi:microsomal epoxide hydrolase
LFFHGWPGSFLEFLPLMEILRTRYTPETLPYHIIVPSLPGYAFTELPMLEKGYGVADAARLFSKLASGLGFKRYIAQGGDIGSRVARIIGATDSACKGS